MILCALLLLVNKISSFVYDFVEITSFFFMHVTLHRAHYSVIVGHVACDISAFGQPQNAAVSTHTHSYIFGQALPHTI